MVSPTKKWWGLRQPNFWLGLPTFLVEATKFCLVSVTKIFGWGYQIFGWGYQIFGQRYLKFSLLAFISSPCMKTTLLIWIPAPDSPVFDTVSSIVRDQIHVAKILSSNPDDIDIATWSWPRSIELTVSNTGECNPRTSILCHQIASMYR